jgi:hypothetical protein
MEIKLNIPDYLSIKQWKEFTSMEHLSDSEKMIKLITLLSDKEETEVKSWTPMALKQVYANVLEAISDIDASFYPIFELDGVRYGFSSISKLTLGEYVDLERLAKKPQENIEEIMAILYRPIVKDRFKGIKWAFKNAYKVGLGDAENLFKYYELEKYDSSTRLDNANKLSVLPASMALGALTFFLTLANTSLVGSSLSSLSPSQQMIAMKEMTKQMASMNIGAGLQQFITSQVLPSFKSPITIASLN